MNAEAVLEFWFPDDLGDDADRVLTQVQWWFRGGSNKDVRARFSGALEMAEDGKLEHWKTSPRSRLALILVLDQFSRAIYGNDSRAYRNDAAARDAAREGIGNGHYACLISCWERTFFTLPFGHSENLADANLAVALAEEIAENAPAGLEPILRFSAEQAKGHRDVIARFGRHPHRNAALGRISTADEEAYLKSGEIVHTRPLPGRAS
jgi:uncharacterized protein (DUF924 family)